MGKSWHTVDRRSFLKSSAVATSGLLSGTVAWAGDAKLRQVSASDRVNLALVGIGGRSVHDRQMLQATGMCNIVALCDVDLEGPRTLPTRIANGDSPGEVKSHERIDPKAAVFQDFRKMFDKMATDVPNHWENFLLSCRGVAEPASPFSVGGPLTQVLNLGVICQQLGGSLEFDIEKQRIKNNDRANSLLDPLSRDGWEEFYRM